ncbi:MAG TPA: ankyrin repeat domain-containing protein [Rickettsia endosymbiont of Columbicola hoogstraali]|nr:ankyrin repeat domain-containing protein [Rickettsia endosymbiont of Columbicola hoogstraali]
MHYATERPNEELSEFPIKNNHQLINIVDNEGSTVLHTTASQKHVKICELLISKMTYQLINQVNNHGYTALHYAPLSGQENICELIIKEHPQLIDVIDNNGKTALDIAKSRNCNKIVELITTKLTQIQQEKQKAELLAVQKAEQEELQFKELLSALRENNK